MLAPRQPTAELAGGIAAAVVGVVLNLAIWFAIHTLFRQVAMWRLGPVRFDAPVLASVDPWALLLSVAAAVAILRFKAGTLVTLAATSAVGVALYGAGVTG